MEKPPFDQRIARVLVKPLATTPLTPNALTIFTMALALVAAWLLAQGSATEAYWGAGVFVVARFLDHFDGELARLTGRTSKLGYYLDYVSGAVSYGALFAGIGIGLSSGWLSDWALALGAAGLASAVISMFLNLGLDREQNLAEGDAVGYPGYAGFELEDGIYLLAPITWLGWLEPFFIAAGIGAAVYCLWTLFSLLRLRLARRAG